MPIQNWKARRLVFAVALAHVMGIALAAAKPAAQQSADPTNVISNSGFEYGSRRVGTLERNPRTRNKPFLRLIPMFASKEPQAYT